MGKKRIDKEQREMYKKAHIQYTVRQSAVPFSAGFFSCEKENEKLKTSDSLLVYGVTFHDEISNGSSAQR